MSPLARSILEPLNPKSSVPPGVKPKRAGSASNTIPEPKRADRRDSERKPARDNRGEAEEAMSGGGSDRTDKYNSMLLVE